MLDSLSGKTVRISNATAATRPGVIAGVITGEVLALTGCPRPGSGDGTIHQKERHQNKAALSALVSVAPVRLRLPCPQAQRRGRAHFCGPGMPARRDNHDIPLSERAFEHHDEAQAPACST